MMKRKILAAVIPALLAAATANAAEIYNKDGNKLDLYGKAVGRHVWTTRGDSNLGVLPTGLGGDARVAEGCVSVTVGGALSYFAAGSAPNDG
ncbi:hypothetical protein MJL06_17970, partial [Salmonella enterica subsp. enterica serovar Montevideo]|nr:hypothetical protein [Salmonella enterica subsp. enterica serovar Montevideo]